MAEQITKLPYLTTDLPGVGGRIKDRPEDFRVDEMPLYEPGGEGTHLYFRIRKTGISTSEAIARIARFMGVSRQQIGAAGRKDAAAVTTQMLSLEHADADKLAGFSDGNITVEGTWRHNNKLRPGHLAGNRFTVRIRGIGGGDLARAREILAVLQARGVPNYFGPQRFGARGQTAALGKALLAGKLDEFVKMFLGGPRPDDPPRCRAAREAFDAGYYNRALQRWPWKHRDQRRALRAYKKRRRPRDAVSAVGKRMRWLFISAFQSEVFNDFLSRRIETIDRVFEGDVAERHDSGGQFIVEDVDTEQSRLERFEISPTGPIFGSRCIPARGEVGRLEAKVMEAHGCGGLDLTRAGSLKVKGTRRALRFKISDVNISAEQGDGDFLELSFTAPPGCYATVVLREIMKND